MNYGKKMNLVPRNLLFWDVALHHTGINEETGSLDIIDRQSDLNGLSYEEVSSMTKL
jgi:hypothetical protein